MAKKTYKISEVGTLTKVARMIDEPRSTLKSAIRNGHVDRVQLGCGSNVVVIASARAWKKSDRQAGRPHQD